MGRRFGFFNFVLAAILVLIVVGVAYSLGVAAGQAQPVGTGAVVYPVAYWHPFIGFPFFGFLFFFLFIGLIFAAFRSRRWSGGPGGPGGPGWGHGGRGHPGGPGRGPGWTGPVDPNDPRARWFQEGDVPPMFQPMLETWHQRAHDQGSGASGASAPPASPASPDRGDRGNGGPSGPTATA